MSCWSLLCHPRNTVHDPCSSLLTTFLCKNVEGRFCGNGWLRILTRSLFLDYCSSSWAALLSHHPGLSLCLFLPLSFSYSEIRTLRHPDTHTDTDTRTASSFPLSPSPLLSLFPYAELGVAPFLLCVLLLINKCYFWTTLDSSFWKTRGSDYRASSMEPKEEVITFHSQPR